MELNTLHLNPPLQRGGDAFLGYFQGNLGIEEQKFKTGLKNLDLGF